MALAAGDIAFVRLDGDEATGDNFSFVALTAIAAGEVVFFTDNGFDPEAGDAVLGSSNFRGGENVFTWTAPAGGVSAGTVVTITGVNTAVGGNSTASVGTVVNTAGTANSQAAFISTTGDSIIAYVNSAFDAANPTIIAAVNMFEGAWQAEATNTNTSGDPLVASPGQSVPLGTAGSTPDAWVYTGPTSGTAADLRAALNLSSNFTVLDTSAVDDDPAAAPSFTISSGPTSGDDNLTGTAGADTIDLLAGADTYDGLDGADTITGGADADTLTGGAGDDTFIAAEGDLVAGESIDGGADTDTLELGAGTHSLVGVTLSNVESITLANAASSSLTLADASQVALVTAAPGADDTVILDGFLTYPEQLQLAAAGVENVQFTNANGTNVSHFAGGVLQSLDVTYDAANTTFDSARLVFDASGAIVSATTVFDSSITETQVYSGGQRVQVNKNDGAGGVEFDWTDQSFFFTGGALTGLDQSFDDGRSERIEYGAGGVITRVRQFEADGDGYDIRYSADGTQLVSTERTDVSNVEAFSTRTNSYTNGVLSQITTVLDTGIITVTNFGPDGITRTSIEQNDSGFDDVMTLTGGSVPETVRGGNGADTFLAAAGVLIAGETVDGGAGDDTLALGAGAHSLVGVTLTDLEFITLADAPENVLTLGDASQAGLVSAAPGADDTVIFDGFLTFAEQQSLGTAGVEHVQFENANGTNVVNFEAGVLTSLDVTYDPANTTLDSVSIAYDAAGRVDQTETVFDNGLRTVTTYDDAGQRTGYTQFDDGNAFSYASLMQTFVGGTVATSVVTQDSGARSHTATQAGQTLTGSSANDSMRGFVGGQDTFEFAPGGGKDFIVNFENGVDLLDLEAFGFADFAAVEAVATGAQGWTLISFADGGSLTINGLSRADLDAGDVVI